MQEKRPWGWFTLKLSSCSFLYTIDCNIKGFKKISTTMMLEIDLFSLHFSGWVFWGVLPFVLQPNVCITCPLQLKMISGHLPFLDSVKSLINLCLNTCVYSLLPSNSPPVKKRRMRDHFKIIALTFSSQ